MIDIVKRSKYRMGQRALGNGASSINSKVSGDDRQIVVFAGCFVSAD